MLYIVLDTQVLNKCRPWNNQRIILVNVEPLMLKEEGGEKEEILSSCCMTGPGLGDL